MPIYAYRCTSCGHAQDVLRKISDPPLNACPACGAETFVKQVTAAGFQLKGSGWYVTDFRGDDKTKAAKSGDGDAAPAADAKPAEGGSAPANGQESAKGDAARSEPAVAPAPAAAVPAAAPAATTPSQGGT